jgi:hypothetical protein
MSYSNPKQTNPATKFIEFKGDKGIFQFYNKELEEPKNVELPMPLYFVVLDELSTISGYSNKLECSFYSNEVHSLTDEVLKVKSFKGGFNVTGKYKDIRDTLVANGAKFTKSVYAMLITGKDQFELVHFKFSGASFASWLEKKFNTQEFGVQVKSTKQEKHGSVVYNVPVFEKLLIPKDRMLIHNTATEMDKKLQIYLKAYKAGQLENMEMQEISENQIDESASTKTGEFDMQKHFGSKNENAPVDDVSDLPF